MMRLFLRGGKGLVVKEDAVVRHGDVKGSWVGKACVKVNRAGTSNKVDQLISIIVYLMWMDR